MVHVRKAVLERAELGGRIVGVQANASGRTPFRRRVQDGDGEVHQTRQRRARLRIRRVDHAADVRRPKRSRLARDAFQRAPHETARAEESGRDRVDAVVVATRSHTAVFRARRAKRRERVVVSLALEPAFGHGGGFVARREQTLEEIEKSEGLAVARLERLERADERAERGETRARRVRRQPAEQFRGFRAKHRGPARKR